MKTRILILVVGVALVPTTAFAFWFELMVALAGGQVIDVAKVAQLGQQYVVDANKLNQLNATNATAHDQLVALQAMRTVYGDGNGVEAYVPSGTINFSPEMQKSIASYADSFPKTAEGETMRAYLQRQNDRELQLQLYAQRVKSTAESQNRSNLTLTELAAIDNELNSQAADARLEAIAASADANGTKALLRQRQLEIRDYQQSRDRLEGALRN